jgi:hypothetical protein
MERLSFPYDLVTGEYKIVKFSRKYVITQPRRNKKRRKFGSKELVGKLRVPNSRTSKH